MTTGYQIVNQDGLYYQAVQVIEGVDVFTRQVRRDIVVERLKYCTNHKDLSLWIYLIMPNQYIFDHECRRQ